MQSNQKDAANGQDIDSIRRLKRMKKKLQPYNYFTYESKSSIFDEPTLEAMDVPTRETD